MVHEAGGLDLPASLPFRPVSLSSSFDYRAVNRNSVLTLNSVSVFQGKTLFPSTY